ncbi:MAG: Eco57I restriction-modification methylase domain-containing protein, partial [Alphaproteobacteria bacterium]|nr:Eco57I restriction-modification methylase domain-containing protein [Alphaproteobacteria bacterium]
GQMGPSSKCNEDCYIDIIETDIESKYPGLLRILLRDRTTGRNIIWACDEYRKHGEQYTADHEITIKQITGKNTRLIRPRIAKSREECRTRTRKSAEVFTPAFIIAEMLNYCDEQWFGVADTFNTLKDKDWTANPNKIPFKNTSDWQRYVDSRRLEITCGEGPYLTSRYDTTTGDYIPVERRIGILDRKLRVVDENTTNESEWLKWVIRAYCATYGYEYQGDNLLLARENLIWTFIDNYKCRFNKDPDLDTIKNIARIISWNIWQMDGLTTCVPCFGDERCRIQLSLFGGLIPDEGQPQLCQIKNWRSKTIHNFQDLKGAKSMKFDFCIGNPPYQETKNKTETQTQANSNWIYQFFQFEADKIANCSCLIYPFGGWFDAPSRLNGLGNKLLTDRKTVLIRAYEGTTDKRAWYRQDKQPNPVFGSNVNLSAGVSIVLRNNKENDSFVYSNRIYSDTEVTVPFDRIEDITPNPVFIGINNKLVGNKLNTRIKKGIFDIESDFVEKNPNKVSFNKDDWDTPVQLLTNDKSGSSGRAKLYWTDVKHIPKGREYFDMYKVIMTSAYPKQKLVSGVYTLENVKKRIEELVEVLPPNSAFGRSRLALFMSKKQTECENFIKYTKTDFFAGLVLQEPNRSSSFGYVIPDQDFSDNSDIDWSKPVEDINKQLYKKYQLDKSEIEFLESGAQEVA